MNNFIHPNPPLEEYRDEQHRAKRKQQRINGRKRKAYLLIKKYALERGYMENENDLKGLDKFLDKELETYC